MNKEEILEARITNLERLGIGMASIIKDSLPVTMENALELMAIEFMQAMQTLKAEPPKAGFIMQEDK